MFSDRHTYDLDGEVQPVLNPARPTEWLSGSGGVGETPYQLWHILANRACLERQSRCPTGAGVRRCFGLESVLASHISCWVARVLVNIVIEIPVFLDMPVHCELTTF
jgi:hypothetical protein